MIGHLVVAVIVGVVVGLVCILVGRLISSASVPPAAAVGGFLGQYAWAIAIVVAVLWFITGRGLPF